MSSEKAKLKIALAGNPNSGKSTLFNLLTGLNQKTGNFAGVTVDKKTGHAYLHHPETKKEFDANSIHVPTQIIIPNISYIIQILTSSLRLRLNVVRDGENSVKIIKKDKLILKVI